MNLNKIKTRSQFNEFADIWYQRVHQLREIWQNENEIFDRKSKSYILWLHMVKRVMHLTQIAIKLNTPKMPKGFKKGGYTIAKINYKKP